MEKATSVFPAPFKLTDYPASIVALSTDFLPSFPTPFARGDTPSPPKKRRVDDLRESLLAPKRSSSVTPAIARASPLFPRSASVAPGLSPVEAEHLSKRLHSTLRLREAWADIAYRHEVAASFSNLTQQRPVQTRALREEEDDVIDLRSLEVVVDRGVIRGMKEGCWEIGNYASVRSTELRPGRRQRHLPKFRVSDSIDDDDEWETGSSEEDSEDDILGGWSDLCSQPSIQYREARRRQEEDIRELKNFYEDEARVRGETLDLEEGIFSDEEEEAKATAKREGSTLSALFRNLPRSTGNEVLDEVPEEVNLSDEDEISLGPIEFSASSKQATPQPFEPLVQTPMALDSPSQHTSSPFSSMNRQMSRIELGRTRSRSSSPAKTTRKKSITTFTPSSRIHQGAQSRSAPRSRLSQMHIASVGSDSDETSDDSPSKRTLGNTSKAVNRAKSVPNLSSAPLIVNTPSSHVSNRSYARSFQKFEIVIPKKKISLKARHVSPQLSYQVKMRSKEDPKVSKSAKFGKVGDEPIKPLVWDAEADALEAREWRDVRIWTSPTEVMYQSAPAGHVDLPIAPQANHQLASPEPEPSSVPSPIPGWSNEKQGQVNNKDQQRAKPATTSHVFGFADQELQDALNTFVREALVENKRQLRTRVGQRINESESLLRYPTAINSKASVDEERRMDASENVLGLQTPPNSRSGQSNLSAHLGPMRNVEDHTNTMSPRFPLTESNQEVFSRTRLVSSNVPYPTRLQSSRKEPSTLTPSETPASNPHFGTSASAPNLAAVLFGRSPSVSLAPERPQSRRYRSMSPVKKEAADFAASVLNRNSRSNLHSSERSRKLGVKQDLEEEEDEDEDPLLFLPYEDRAVMRQLSSLSAARRRTGSKSKTWEEVELPLDDESDDELALK